MYYQTQKTHRQISTRSVYALRTIDKETGEQLEDPAEREKRLAAEKKQEESEAKDKEVRRIQDN